MGSRYFQNHPSNKHVYSEIDNYGTVFVTVIILSLSSFVSTSALIPDSDKITWVILIVIGMHRKNRSNV
jgi:hypothetical protein